MASDAPLPKRARTNYANGPPGHAGTRRAASRLGRRRRAQLAEQTLHDAIEERLVGLAVEKPPLAQLDAPREHRTRAFVDLVALAVDEQEVALHRAHVVQLRGPARFAVGSVEDFRPGAYHHRAGQPDRVTRLRRARPGAGRRGGGRRGGVGPRRRGLLREIEIVRRHREPALAERNLDRGWRV